MKIDIDDNASTQKLTLREKIGLWVLLQIFYMVYPAKYTHQLKEMDEKINELLK